MLEAFDLTGSLRDAGELAGCSHHTVGHYVTAREAGVLSARPAARPQLIDGYLDKVEEWIERSQGKLRAQAHIHRGLPDTTLQRQHRDLVVTADGLIHPRHQLTLLHVRRRLTRVHRPPAPPVHGPAPPRGGWSLRGPEQHFPPDFTAAARGGRRRRRSPVVGVRLARWTDLLHRSVLWGAGRSGCVIAGQVGGCRPPRRLLAGWRAVTSGCHPQRAAAPRLVRGERTGLVRGGPPRTGRSLRRLHCRVVHRFGHGHPAGVHCLVGLAWPAPPRAREIPHPPEAEAKGNSPQICAVVPCHRAPASTLAAYPPKARWFPRAGGTACGTSKPR